MPQSKAETPKVTSEQVARFSRETAAGYDRTVIDRVYVILVGCGALGQFLALILALIGYPNVLFIDMDMFEESNISRSPFYREGWHKAKATAVGARGLCTAIGRSAYCYVTEPVQRLGDAIFRLCEHTVVFSAVDNQPARRWLAQRCRTMGVPLFEGGFRGDRWNLSVFPNRSEDEPCWHCDRAEEVSGRLFSCETYARQAMEAGLTPATAPGAAALAANQAGVATAFLHGEEALASTTIFGNLREGTTRIMKRVANPDCQLDHRISASTAIDLKSGPNVTVAELLREVASSIADPIVELPASFIRIAPCGQCRQATLIELPEWAIEETPRCEHCDGRYSRCPNLLPEQHGTLSEQTSETIGNLPLRQVGLGPGLHLNVAGRSDQQVVALAGDPTDPVKAVT